MTDPPMTTIGPNEAELAINKMRMEYRRRLGQSPYDALQIPYAEKSARLLAVYNAVPDHNIADAVLYSE